jgi:hypothetical protein
MNSVEKLDLRNDKGCIDYDRIVELMAIEKNDLAEMINYERTSLKSNKPASPKMIAALSPYIRILVILWDQFGGDAGKVTKWLNDPQKEWLYLSPIEMMKRKKADKVVEFLTAHLDDRADIFNG